MGTVEDVATKLAQEDWVNLSVGEVPYEVVALEGSDALSELFSFTLTCRAPSLGPAPAALIGAEAAISLVDGIGNGRRMHGIVSECRRAIFEDGGAHVVFVVRPQMFLMTLGRDSRVFQDMTVPQIVAKVLERSTAPRRFELTRSYEKHVYAAQYREDDWTFVSRMLEEEGIYYWFEHGEKSTLVIADQSKSAPELVGGKLIAFREEQGMLTDREQIVELGARCRANPSKFTVGSFDEQKPALKVTAAAGTGTHEMYDSPGGGPEDPGHCQEVAGNRLDAATADRHGIQGTSSSVRLVPGMSFEVWGHARLDGEYLVTRARYDVKQRRRFTADSQGGYRTHFEAIPKGQPFRPLEKTPLAKQAGLQSGRVVGPAGEEIHTDERGRVRVQLHWDREGGWDHQAGKWLRMAQRGTAMSMLYPRMGWNVMALMSEGDVDAPSVLSRVHDAEHPPTYRLPENKTRTVFRTSTSPGGGSQNEIRFEDIAGAQEMFLNASKDMNITIQDTKGDVVSRNQTRVIDNNQTRKIGTELHESVYNDQTVTVGGNEKLEIGSDRRKDVAGNEDSTIGGNREVKAGTNVTNQVTEQRELTVSGSAMEKTTGNMLLQGAKTQIDVGGALMRTSKKGIITENVGNVLTAKVGGAKIEIAGENRLLDVNERFEESIAGCLMMQTGESFMDGTDEKTLWTVSGPMTGSAPHIHIEAKDKIELICGGSKLTIDENQVTITSPSYDLSASADIVAVTKLIRHN
jgi:type VI secretion system secreted protein VgrG